MIELEKKESIYFLSMNAGENRWNTSFVREFAIALDEIEKDVGPGALITSSKDPKFFSNGFDVNIRKAKKPRFNNPIIVKNFNLKSKSRSLL